MLSQKEGLEIFYDLLDQIENICGGKYKLSSCNGQMDWPKRGVYFFFENGEMRSGSGAGARVVRVGTHALKSGSSATLWKRLRNHRGLRSGKGGNHRSSIFRLLVGEALIEHERITCPTWGKDKSDNLKADRSAERELEQSVSAYIGEMPFLCLPVDDEIGPQSKRGEIEKGSIGLLSQLGESAVDPPTPKWLGRKCTRERVKTSGLWNNNHVGCQYCPSFLTDMKHYVDKIGDV